MASLKRKGKGPGSSHYKQKLQTWSTKMMKEALMFYFQGKSGDGPALGYKKVTQLYNLPKETFRKRTTGKYKGYYGYLCGGKDMPRIFSDDQEQELAGHISKFAQAGFPFTPTEIRDLTYEFASENDVSGFNMMNKSAGRKWQRYFMKRHKELTIRTPKILSIYRVQCANREVLNAWFEKYGDVLAENNITSPLYIWNCDECGCIDVPKPKAVVCKSKVRPTQLTPSEKGETTTVLTFVNAAGLVMKPLVIHKGGKIMEAWKNHMPKGISLAATKTGWITKQTF